MYLYLYVHAHIYIYTYIGKTRSTRQHAAARRELINYARGDQ